MQISESGLQQIIRREGVILHAYQDSVGVWTIGTGHTTAAGPPTVRKGMVISKQDNDTILLRDLSPIEAQAKTYIRVPVTQNQYDAIISIVFNVGPKFWKSTCIKKLNAGDIQGAAQAIMLWNKPPEIIGRRRTEQKQFLTPDGPGNVTHSTAGTIVAAGAAASYHWYDYWPYILGGTLLTAGLIYLTYYLYRKYHGNS